jgi:hypothetical protein
MKTIIQATLLTALLTVGALFHTAAAGDAMHLGNCSLRHAGTCGLLGRGGGCAGLGAHGFHVLGGCGSCGAAGGCGHGTGVVGHATELYYKAVSAAHAGQPLVDPWARADWIAQQKAAVQSWHAGYYHTGWGVPVSLIAPPTARMQTRWSWGVAQSSMYPLYHQFKRPYPGPVFSDLGSSPLLPTPRWPSHTDQFGVYWVRGPW